MGRPEGKSDFRKGCGLFCSLFKWEPKPEIWAFEYFSLSFQEFVEYSPEEPRRDGKSGVENSISP